MTQMTRIERRKRGMFGWLFLILFWTFNLVMAVWVIAAINVIGSAPVLTEGAERAGAALGAVVGFGIILSTWLAGNAILGLFVLLTRGNKVVVETTEEA
jgi:hypothetical protein